MATAVRRTILEMNTQRRRVAAAPSVCAFVALTAMTRAGLLSAAAVVPAPPAFVHPS
jgi:hypothetical protein